MDTVDLRLAQDCETLAVAASEGVTWLKGAAEQSPTVAQQAPSLISELWTPSISDWPRIARRSPWRRARASPG
ncbi:hypothetical protein [Reyranella sp.]|uniref:hypothetical protein n=1 Tax=Reyranella sp. TaxID=1929291 RepID=UPI0037852D2C